MEKISILVNYKDQDYSKALTKALLIRHKVLDTPNVNSDSCVTIDESVAPCFMPVHFYYETIMAKLNRKAGPAKPQENVLYFGFSAACGGTGLTTTAICFARIMARINKYKVGFVSFDPWFRQKFDKEDEFGVLYFSELPKDADVDVLVLDIPSCLESAQDLLDICEKRIVISGFNEKRLALSDVFYDSLCESANTYIIPPKTYKFQNHLDYNPDPSDIHGQLGKEMLAFVNELEREQA